MTPDEVKTLRIDLGLTQEQLARVAGTTSTSISRWERGYRTPSPLAVQALEAARAKVGPKTPRKKSRKRLN